MEYKITFKNHIRNLSGMKLIFTVHIFFLFILWDNDDYEYTIQLIKWFLIIFSAIVAVTFSLHLEYYNLNKTTILKNKEESQELFVNERRIPYEHILTVKYVMPHRWHGVESMHYFSTSEYHYAKLTTVDGDVFYITSLLCGDVQKVLSSLNNQPHIQIEKYKWMFCSPWWFEKDEIQ